MSEQRAKGCLYAGLAVLVWIFIGIIALGFLAGIANASIDRTVGVFHFSNAHESYSISCEKIAAKDLPAPLPTGRKF